MRTVLLLLVLALPADAAPRLKDRPPRLEVGSVVDVRGWACRVAGVEFDPWRGRWAAVLRCEADGREFRADAEWVRVRQREGR